MLLLRQFLMHRVGDAATGASAAPVHLRVLDLGTGSGCLLLAVLNRLWHHQNQKAEGRTPFLASGCGVDIDPVALSVAAENARATTAQRTSPDPLGDAAGLGGDEARTGGLPWEGVVLCEGTFRDFGAGGNGGQCGTVRHVVSSRGSSPRGFSVDDAFGAEGCNRGSSSGAVRGPFDVILCNPPYLDEATSALDAASRSRDPHHAVFAGGRGMAAYEALAANSALWASASNAQGTAANALGGGDGRSEGAKAGPSSDCALLAPDGAVLVEVPHGRAGPVAATLAPSHRRASPAQQRGDGPPAATFNVGLLRDRRRLERCLVLARSHPCGEAVSRPNQAAVAIETAIEILGAEALVLSSGMSLGGSDSSRMN